MASENKLFLMSADGHVGAPTKLYKQYIPGKYHGEFDAYLARHQWLFSPTRSDSVVSPVLHDSLRLGEGYDPQLGSAVTWDAQLRLRAYDEAGIATEVLIPDDQSCNDPPWCSGLGGMWSPSHTNQTEAYSAEWVQRGAEAYNRWLTDFCSADRKRLRGLTILGSLEDVDWAIVEIRRAYDDGLTTGIVLPLHYSLPLYHHPRYDRLWAVLEEMDLTVVSHISKGGPYWVGNNITTVSAIWFLEYEWYSQRPLWCLIFGGILERHPKLRIAVTEAGVDWVAPLLKNFDVAASSPFFREFPEKKAMSMTPREYFQRQCFVTHSSEFNIQRAHLEGEFFKSIPNMIWGSDLGHGEGFWPSAMARLRKLLDGQRENDMRSYLGEYAYRAYPALRRSEYESTIDRIGPTAAALGLVA
jgi:predicted TIM-barrel fold metal-dependent hydrolase